MKFRVILVYFNLGDNQKQKKMKISIEQSSRPISEHERNSVAFINAIQEKNPEEIENNKKQFCTSLLEDAVRRVKEAEPRPEALSFAKEEGHQQHSFIEEEPKYLKAFIKIAQKLIIEKQMNPEDIIEILCTDKDFVEWLIQKAKEIVNYVVKKVSGGKYSPFEDDVLLGSVDLKSHAEDVMNDEARSSSTAGVPHGDWTKHVTAVAVRGGHSLDE